MRILFITNGWPPGALGGVEVYARRLAFELSKRRTVSVFCREAAPDKPDYSMRSFDDGPVRVTAVNYTFGDLADFRGTYFIEPMGGVLEKYLDANGLPDIAHIHHLGAIGHRVLETLVARGIPIVFTQHDYALTCPRGQRIADDFSICEGLSVAKCLECLKPQCKGSTSNVEKLYRYLFRKQAGRDMLDSFWKSSERVMNLAKIVIAPSEHLAKRIVDDGFPLDRIRILPYGYDKAPFEAVRRGKIGLVNKFGYLGSLIPSKGVHILIEAFKLLVKEMPDAGLELHIHGPAPTYHGSSEYPTALKTISADAPITFHGAYKPDELPGILGGLDAVVAPSLWWETHGIVVREAKLAGLPVIVSDHGAIGEAVADGVNGLKSRPGNVKGLRDKMRILASTSGLADSLASNPMKIKDISDDAVDHEKLYSVVQAKTAP